MNLLGKLAIVPFLSFFTMLVSVALLGKEGMKEMPWLFPDNNAWKVYVGWMIILFIYVLIRHFTKRKIQDDG